MTTEERDDAYAAANIQQVKAYSIKALTDAGFSADSAVAAVTANDFSRLKGK